MNVYEPNKSFKLSYESHTTRNILDDLRKALEEGPSKYVLEVLWVTPRDSDPPIKGDSMQLKGLKLLIIRPGHVQINQIRVHLKGPLEGYSPDEILHCLTTAYSHSCSQAVHQPEHSPDEILHCQTRTCTCTCTCSN